MLPLCLRLHVPRHNQTPEPRHTGPPWLFPRALCESNAVCFFRRKALECHISPRPLLSNALFSVESKHSRSVLQAFLCLASSDKVLHCPGCGSGAFLFFFLSVPVLADLVSSIWMFLSGSFPPLSSPLSVMYGKAIRTCEGIGLFFLLFWESSGHVRPCYWELWEWRSWEG